MGDSRKAAAEWYENYSDKVDEKKAEQLLEKLDVRAFINTINEIKNATKWINTVGSGNRAFWGYVNDLEKALKVLDYTQEKLTKEQEQEIEKNIK